MLKSCWTCDVFLTNGILGVVYNSLGMSFELVLPLCCPALGLSNQMGDVDDSAGSVTAGQGWPHVCSVLNVDLLLNFFSLLILFVAQI
jgi:hypothetical protein